MMKKRLRAFFVLLLLVFSMCSCSKNQQVTDEMFALDTIITFKITDEDEKSAKDTIEKCKNEITRLENLLSATKENTDVYNINHSNNEKVKVNKETATLLKSCVEISDTCDGAFDISVYPLVKLWGFDTKDYKVPTDAQIEEVLKKVNYKYVSVTDDNYVTLKESMSIDLGAVAKGYIAERLYSILAEQKVSLGIINLGGTIVLYSEKDEADDFVLGVEYPDTGEVFCTFKTKTAFTVTSGDYQRYFEENGERYHHIIDPATGKPSESDISSVTLITDDGVSADALSTAFYVMGIDKTLQYIETHTDKSGDKYSFIILNSNKDAVYISADLEQNGFDIEKAFRDKISVNVVDTIFE